MPLRLILLGLVICITKTNGETAFTTSPTVFRTTSKLIETEKYVEYDPPENELSPEVEKVFFQLASHCTLYFFGNPVHTLLFARFLHTCVLSHNGYCKMLQSSTENATNSIKYYHYEWDSIVERIAGGPQKFSGNCVVLLPFVNQSKPEEILLFTYIGSYGRISPDYVITSTLIEVGNFGIGLNEYNRHSSKGSSMVLIASEKEKKLFMLCFPCSLEPLPKSDTSSSGYFPGNFIPTTVLPISVEDWLRTGPDRSLIDLKKYLGDIINFEIHKIKALWLRLHKNLKNHQEPKISEDPRFFRGIDTICGNLSNSGRKADGTSFNEGLVRFRDPQERCLYKTILEHHNHSTTDNKDPVISMPRYTRYYYNPYYREPKSWYNRKYYISQGVGIHGFQYSIFVNRKFVINEFDLSTLSRPLSGWVWLTLLAVICILVIFVKLFEGKSRPFYIIAMLLEQGVIFQSWKNTKICLILTSWMLATIQLRLTYTGSMYSYLTAEIQPDVPNDLKELVIKYGDKYGVFVSYDGFEILTRMFKSDLRNLPRNGSQFKFLSKFMRAMEVMYEYDLPVIWGDDVTNSTSTDDDIGGNPDRFNRFVLLFQTHPSKMSYVNYEESGRKREWQPHTPLQTALIASGKYLHIKKDNPSIYATVWLFQGTRNFFTEFFCRDFGALVQAGIYSRWEELTSKYVEKDYLSPYMSTLKLSVTSYKERSKMAWKVPRVDNYSIRVIWAVYLSCMGLSFCIFLKEVYGLTIN